jgi:predicted lipid-binding transport protein (Tim44 family)
LAGVVWILGGGAGSRVDVEAGRLGGPAGPLAGVAFDGAALVGGAFLGAAVLGFAALGVAVVGVAFEAVPFTGAALGRGGFRAFVADGAVGSVPSLAAKASRSGLSCSLAG